MSSSLLVLGAVGFGVGSAIVPLLNAEAYAIVSSTHEPVVVVACVAAALACGQTAGKLLLFEAARRSNARLGKVLRRPRHRPHKWTARAKAVLDRPGSGAPLVLVSASLGFPPLAVVALAAGASAQSRFVFGAACFAGRLMRFTALAVPTAWALT
jgi:membrane protein YqaA with SNARE-associated domain